MPIACPCASSLLALQELPVRQLSPAAASAQDSSLQAAAPGAAQSQALAVAVIEALARRTSDAAHVAEAVGGVCASLPAEPEAACSTVQLCISAAVAAAASHQVGACLADCLSPCMYLSSLCVRCATCRRECEAESASKLPGLSSTGGVHKG